MAMRSSGSESRRRLPPPCTRLATVRSTTDETTLASWSSSSALSSGSACSTSTLLFLDVGGSSATTLIFDTELSRFFIRDAPLSRPATLVICRPVPGICLSSQGVPRRARRKPIERGTTLEPGPRGLQERLSTREGGQGSDENRSVTKIKPTLASYVEKQGEENKSWIRS